jgi:arsenate reductase
MILYGLKHCDTTQKALKYLDAKKVKYTFHDYKESGITEPVVRQWFRFVPVDKVINARSTTFQELPEKDKLSIADPDKAVALIIKHTSIVKRPLLDLGQGRFLLGFKPKEWDEVL